jgi:hypothetical protein
MADPNDQKLVSEIEFKTGARPRSPMIALDASIKNAIVEARPRPQDGPEDVPPERAEGGRRADGHSPRERRGRDAGSGGALPLRRASRWSSTNRLMDEVQELALIESLGRRARRLPRRAPARARGRGDARPSWPWTTTQRLRMIEMLLQSKRYRVLTARAGREALAKVRESDARPRDPGRHAPRGPRVRDLPPAQDLRALPAHPGRDGLGRAHGLALSRRT